MIKGFRQIASITALSRVFGLIRDMVFSHFLGESGLMDAWVIAFRIPNLARRLFGEGAASASLIPVYSEQLEKDPHQAARLANTVVTVIFVLLAAIVLLGWLAIYTYGILWAQTSETKLILSLSATMLPYMLMVCTVAILAGILNVHRHFAAPAAAPVILNVFIITAALLAGAVLKVGPREQVFAIAAAVLIAGLIQISIQFVPLRACGVSIRPAWDVHSDAFKKILIMMAPMIIGLTATQINTLADDIIAWCLSGSAEKGSSFAAFGTDIHYPLWRGSVTHLYFSQRLYQLPLGVLGISLATAIFPVMSAAAAAGNLDSLSRTVARGIKGAIFIGLPTTVGLILVAQPFISAVFEHGKFSANATKMTTLVVCCYAPGLTGYFSQQILTRGFYSIQDSGTPAKSALIAVCVNVILNLSLIWFMGAAGLALSTAICSYLQVCILVIVLRKRLGRSILQGVGTALGKTFVATVISLLVGGAVMVGCAGLPESRVFNVLRLGIVVPATAGVYILAAGFLHIEMLSLLTGTGRSDQCSTD